MGVVLAAGKGEGLRPLTNRTQKEAINILGKPLVKYSVDGLRYAGVNDILVVVNESRDVPEALSGERGVEFVRQRGEGLSGALASVMEYVEDEFVLAFGDIVAPPQFFAGLMTRYAESGGGPVISLVPVGVGLPTYGLALVEEGRIKDLVQDGSSLALAGVYVLRRGDPSHFMDYISNNAKGSPAYIWGGEWIDVGYPEDVIRAVKVMLNGRGVRVDSKADVPGSVRIHGDVVIERDAVIGENSVLKGPVYIGRGVFVGDFSLIRNGASLEEGASVGAYVEMASSSVQPGARVGSKSYLTSTIVGRGAEVGAGVVSATSSTWGPRSTEPKRGPVIEPFSVVDHGRVVKLD